MKIYHVIFAYFFGLALGTMFSMYWARKKLKWLIEVVMSNPDVKYIVFKIDFPGGSILSTKELSDYIKNKTI